MAAAPRSTVAITNPSFSPAALGAVHVRQYTAAYRGWHLPVSNRNQNGGAADLNPSAIGYDLVLKGGEVFTGGSLQRSTVAVQGETIAAILDPAVDVDATAMVDATGLLVLPGFIDPHVHLRDPGPTYKEDIESGTRAAAAGGVTLVGDMPNCSPPTMGRSAILRKRESIERTASIDVAIWAGARTPEDVGEAWDGGAVGIKVFLHGAVTEPGQGGPDAAWDPSTTSFHPALVVRSAAQLMDLAEAVAHHRVPMAVHLGEQSLFDRHRRNWRGRSFSDVLEEMSAETATEKRIAAHTCIEVAAATGAWIHFVHVPPSVVPLVVESQDDANVTMESFLPLMSYKEASSIGALGFNRYKSPDDIEALWGWISDGTIPIVATDHAPHLLKEKEKAHTDILSGPSGYPELDTSVTMMLDAVSRGRLSLERLVDAMSTQPAALLGRAASKGRIEAGYDADFALVDPDQSWVLGTRPYYTKAGWSPFTGKEVQGRVEYTISRGVVVHDHGVVIAEPGHGRVAGREPSA